MVQNMTVALHETMPLLQLFSHATSRNVAKSVTITVVHDERIEPEGLMAVRTLRNQPWLIPCVGGEFCGGGIAWGKASISVDAANGIKDRSGSDESLAAGFTLSRRLLIPSTVAVSDS